MLGAPLPAGGWEEMVPGGQALWEGEMLGRGAEWGL